MAKSLEETIGTIVINNLSKAVFVHARGGEDIDETAVRTLHEGGQYFIHNDRLFSAKMDLEQVWPKENDK